MKDYSIFFFLTIKKDTTTLKYFYKSIEVFVSGYYLHLYYGVLHIILLLSLLLWLSGWYICYFYIFLLYVWHNDLMLEDCTYYTTYWFWVTNRIFFWKFYVIVCVLVGILLYYLSKIIVYYLSFDFTNLAIMFA